MKRFRFNFKKPDLCQMEAQERGIPRPDPIRGEGLRFSLILWRPGVGGGDCADLVAYPVGHFSQAMQNTTVLFNGEFYNKISIRRAVIYYLI